MAWHAGAAITLLTCLAAWDWSARRLPNILIVALALLAFFAVNPGAVDRLPDWPMALLLLSIGWLLFALDAWGAGDAKLLAACALWTPGQVVDLLVGSALLGGLLALLFGLHRQYRKRRDRATNANANKTELPYGVAIASAGIVEIVSIHFHLLG